VAVRQIVARACERAGLPRLGAHRLRHTLASDLLRAGNSLPRIGQVLVKVPSLPKVFLATAYLK
jgi:integrase/recombinase XerD